MINRISVTLDGGTAEEASGHLMYLPGSANNSLLHWCVALIAPVALMLVAGAVRAPAFAVDDAALLLVVTIAVVSGPAPATLAAVLTVTARYVGPLQLRDPPPLTPIESLVDVALFVGVGAVLNRLLLRARRAQAAAERATERERHVREERERLVASVAHDLATPLTVVRGTVQAAQRAGLGDVNENRLLRRLETAAARASSLARTLTDIRDLGCVRPERMRLVDLRDVLRMIVEMMRVSDRHAIVLDLPDKWTPIEADCERLERVFENIVNNAIKYSPDGGEIRVSLQRHQERATVIIRDHGMGIAPEARNQIFDLAYRAPEALTASPGRGLGLHIAAQIIASHGGTIAARPARGQGTEIVVGLPLARPARHEALASSDR